MFWTANDDAALRVGGELLLGGGLWTPGDGASGLIVVPPPRPLLVVRDGQLYQRNVVSSAVAAEPSSGNQPKGIVRAMASGLIVLTSFRTTEPTRVVGHPDIAMGSSVVRNDTLYVSITEAIYRERRGEAVEIHMTPQADDEVNLAPVRARVRSRWASDDLPDGWTNTNRRDNPQPAPKSVFGDGDDLDSGDGRQFIGGSDYDFDSEDEGRDTTETHEGHGNFDAQRDELLSETLRALARRFAQRQAFPGDV